MAMNDLAMAMSDRDSSLTEREGSPADRRSGRGRRCRGAAVAAAPIRRAPPRDLLGKRIASVLRHDESRVPSDQVEDGPRAPRRPRVDLLTQLLPAAVDPDCIQVAVEPIATVGRTDIAVLDGDGPLGPGDHGDARGGLHGVRPGKEVHGAKLVHVGEDRIEWRSLPIGSQAAVRVLALEAERRGEHDAVERLLDIGGPGPGHVEPTRIQGVLKLEDPFGGIAPTVRVTEDAKGAYVDLPISTRLLRVPLNARKERQLELEQRCGRRRDLRAVELRPRARGSVHLAEGCAERCRRLEDRRQQLEIEHPQRWHDPAPHRASARSETSPRSR